MGVKAPKLILVEGYPGSGKSTLARRIHKHLRTQGRSTSLYTEHHTRHPIPIGDVHHLDLILAGFETRFPEFLKNWRRLARRLHWSRRTVVMESRFWLTGLMLLHIRNVKPEVILDYYEDLLEILKSIEPTLIYLSRRDQDVRALTAASFRVKNEDSAKKGSAESWETATVRLIANQPWSQDRSLTGHDAYGRWLESWLEFCDDLFARYPYQSLLITDANLDWDGSLAKAIDFLDRQNT